MRAIVSLLVKTLWWGKQLLSLEAIYDLQRENPNLDIKYLPVGDKVAVEFGTECSSTAFVTKSCHPNARYRILVTPEGERLSVLSATAFIKKGDEISIDVGATLDPKICSASADLRFMLTGIARRQVARVLLWLWRVCTVIYILWPWSLLLDLPGA